MQSLETVRLFITLVEYAMICELEAKYIFIKILSVKLLNYIHFLLHSSFNGNKRLSSIEDDVFENTPLDEL